MSENEDLNLVLSFNTGDESSFDKILDNYEKPVINFLYRLVGNKTDAEDLAQEVFLRVYQNLKNYQPTGKFSTWLFTIATNIFIDYQRKTSTRKITVTDSLNAITDTENGEIIEQIADKPETLPETVTERNQMNEIIHSAILILPENQRIALTLCVYEDKSYQEISKILSCSVSAVESLIFRARQTLKQSVKKKGIFYL